MRRGEPPIAEPKSPSYSPLCPGKRPLLQKRRRYALESWQSQQTAEAMKSPARRESNLADMETHGRKQPQAVRAADKETSLLGKFAAWRLHSTISNHAGLGNCTERASPPGKFCHLAIAFDNPQPRRAWQLHRESLSAWQVLPLGNCIRQSPTMQGLAIAPRKFRPWQVLPLGGCI